MNRKNKILISGFFFILTILSITTYWIKSKENSFADEIITNASDSFTIGLDDLLSSVKITSDKLTNNIKQSDKKVLENVDLNSFFSTMIKSNKYLKGAALSNNDFSYIIYREKSSWVSTYDIDLSDSVSNWIRMNNKLEIVSEWTDISRGFPNDENFDEINQELHSNKFTWKSSINQIPELRDFLTVLFKAYNTNGDSTIAGLIYSANDLSRNFASVLKFERPLVSVFTTSKNIITPILTSDSGSIYTYQELGGNIANQINKWKETKDRTPHSYSFEKFDHIYWTRISNVEPKVGIAGFAVTISASDLAKTEQKQEIRYLYISIVFALLTIIFLILVFKRNSKVIPVDVEPLTKEQALSLINAGETEFVEFKSSLRWDYREEKVNKVLEVVILKSIAAFANAKGGTLFIGVTDDMEIIGLENDFNTLKKKDVDYFELHLRKLINNQYGIAFSNESVNVKFLTFGEKTVCVIQTHASSNPVFLKTKNKQGAEIEKFYVRSGNASQEIASLTEINSYVNVRFKK